MDYAYLAHSNVTSEDLLRWSAIVQPLPLPEHVTPRGGCPLDEVPDTALMKVSPHLIAHIQRTAAQGGLQVISPRQIPFSRTMLRTPGGERQLGDHVVGSVAEINNVWPTLDGDDMSALLPDEPLPSGYVDHVIQPKTRTTPLTKTNKLLTDPILACLIRGRAVVDILRRDDVAGDADTVLTLLANAWGIPVAALAELDTFTLGIEGPLLRHAIKSDEVYPMTYAPIHIRKVISMGASEVTRHLLPEDTAMDWKRARVFCEAVFAMTMSIEGGVYTDVCVMPPPGDPTARSDRDGVLVFQPAPGSAWSFAPSSFSICPLAATNKPAAKGIPREVLSALTKYVDVVRPVSYALVTGHRAVARQTVVKPAYVADLETLSEGYSIMVKSLVVGGARGRTAAATVRNVIYEAIMNAPPTVKLKAVRYLTITKEEVRTHLGLDIVPDSVIVRLATRFLPLGHKIRSMVVAEAARRGSSAEVWWADILAQAPERYAAFVEGTHGWTKVALWLLFRAPTDRWTKLVAAVKISALHEAARGGTTPVPLPARKGSVERILAASRSTSKEVTQLFAGYYTGVADVGMCIADELDSMRRARSAAIIREGAYLWMLRARAYRGVSVHPIAHDEKLKTSLHRRIPASPVDLVVAPAPYRAYKAYLTHLETSTVVSTEVKKHFAEHGRPPLSDAFASLTRPIVTVPTSTVTRYLMSPLSLGRDMEKSWYDLVGDIARTAKIYVDEMLPPICKPTVAPLPMTVQEIEVIEPDLGGYYAMLARLDQDTAEWVESIVDMLDEVQADVITERSYRDEGELLDVVGAAELACGACLPITAELIH